MYRLSLEGQIEALQGDNIEGYSRRRPDHKQRHGGGGKQLGPLVNLEVARQENGREGVGVKVGLRVWRAWGATRRGVDMLRGNVLGFVILETRMVSWQGARGEVGRQVGGL